MQKGTSYPLPDIILYEDDVLLVVNKPAGLMVEPDRNNHSNLLHLVRQYIKETRSPDEVYAQHIHRLDRPVSGIVLFAVRRSVLKNLSEQFAERRVKKYYQAITEQAIGNHEGTLEHWHRKEKKKAVLYDHEVAYAEKAILHYTRESFGDQHYVWTIELHTGKYHQIRAQLASIGCPIIGDAVYGSTLSYHPDQIALHAHKLILHHPITDEEMIIEAKGPA
jgi:RluA family pseudouridine synthase